MSLKLDMGQSRPGQTAAAPSQKQQLNQQKRQQQAAKDSGLEWKQSSWELQVVWSLAIHK